MNVLSLFDGMGCGRLALNKVDIKINNYFASEIDPYAIKVSKHNFPDITQLGDIKTHKDWDLPKIDLIMGGSPCQDLSRIKAKEGKGLFGEKSKLFFEYVKCIHLYKPEYFFLENVVMNKESNEVITSILGVEPILINSSGYSAQDRPRLYWTNIPVKDIKTNNTLVFGDVMKTNVDEKYFLNDEFEHFYGTDKRMVGTLNPKYPNGKMKYTETTSRVYNPKFKMACLTAVSGGGQHKKVLDNGRPRKLTEIEYERLQNVPDNFTSVVSPSQRYKMLGNGWTVDVIADILKGLK